MKLFDDRDEEQKIWKVRESGLGATAFIPGQPRHVGRLGGLRRAARRARRVPARAPRAVRRVRLRLRRSTATSARAACTLPHQLRSLDAPTASSKYARFIDDAADLVVQLRRLAFRRARRRPVARRAARTSMFGDELVEAFREFKAIWDPDGQDEPGQDRRRLPHRREPAPRPSYHPPTPHDALQPSPTTAALRAHAAMRCVGIGKCRREERRHDVPELHGHARGEALDARPRAPVVRDAARRRSSRDGWRDEEVKDALDLCLACKGCKGDCPVNVDMATYKAEFLSHYYEHHRRPRHAYAFGWIHRWARLGSARAAARELRDADAGIARRSLHGLGGIAPERRDPDVRAANRSRGRSRAKHERAAPMPVCCGPTRSTTTSSRRRCIAAVEVLEDAGLRVVVPRGHLCCGRPLYDYGMLDRARSGSGSAR